MLLIFHLQKPTERNRKKGKAKKPFYAEGSRKVLEPTSDMFNMFLIFVNNKLD